MKGTRICKIKEFRETYFVIHFWLFLQLLSEKFNLMSKNYIDRYVYQNLNLGRHFVFCLIFTKCRKLLTKIKFFLLWIESGNLSILINSHNILNLWILTTLFEDDHRDKTKVYIELDLILMRPPCMLEIQYLNPLNKFKLLRSKKCPQIKKYTKLIFIFVPKLTIFVNQN